MSQRRYFTAFTAAGRRRKKNKDTQWAKNIIDAYHSDEFKEYMKSHNNGLWYVPEDT